MPRAGTGPTRTSCRSGCDDLELGEAVLVEFGRRQALGIVLAEASGLPAVAAKPIVDRVRADGPLLPPLTLRLARWISDRYLAPPALVLRSMLPPGLLERLELVAELAPGGSSAADATEVDLLGQLERGPRPVRDLAGPDGRAGLLRRLRALETDGRISLEWVLLGAGAGPRYERWIRLTEAGTEVAAHPRRRRAADRPCARSASGRGAHRARRGAGRGATGGRPGRSPRARGGGRARPTRSRGGRRARTPPPTAGQPGRPADAADGRRAATCCPPRPMPSSASGPRSARAIRDRSCSMA